MYFPYFRGKQFELILLRDEAQFLACNNAVPIVAPVRTAFNQLDRTLEALNDEECDHIAVANPRAGDYSSAPQPLIEHLVEKQQENPHLIVAVRLDSTTDFSLVQAIITHSNLKRYALIHNDYPDPSGLQDLIHQAVTQPEYNIFLNQASRLYKTKFSTQSVLIEDGFHQMRNRDYPQCDYFSDLYITYRDAGFDHFGDYLTVGEPYTDGGGPAYAVAIHLTYIDTNNDRTLWLRHFVSETNDTPGNPGLKTQEALNKLAEFTQDHPDIIHKTTALNELLRLQREGHYPGLGILKKLSMQHHLHIVEYAKKERSTNG